MKSQKWLYQTFINEREVQPDNVKKKLNNTLKIEKCVEDNTHNSEIALKPNVTMRNVFIGCEMNQNRRKNAEVCSLLTCDAIHNHSIAFPNILKTLMALYRPPKTLKAGVAIT